MSETRERSALEVLRRLDDLAKEGHIVVMGPQDLTDPLWDDIEALLEPTPASDGGEVRVVDDDRRDLAGRLATAADLLDEAEYCWIGGDEDIVPQIIGDMREAAALLRTPRGEGEADAESGGDVTVSQLLAVLDEYNAEVFCMTPENADGTPMFSVAVARGESAERLKQWASEDAHPTDRSDDDAD